MYVARGARTVQIQFTIGNDDVAREDMESYQVALSNPSDTSVILGSAATINIRDTDCNLQNPNPSTRVIVGDRTKIIIKDDDRMLYYIYLIDAITIILFSALVYGFVDSFRTFIENGGNGTFNFVVSRTAKPTSYNMTTSKYKTVRLNSPSSIDQHLLFILYLLLYYRENPSIKHCTFFA